MSATFFHVSPRCNRASIQAHGLDHTRGDSAYTGVSFAPGNYLFTDRATAAVYLGIREQEELDEYGRDAESYDLWRITGIPENLAADEFADDSSGLGKHSVFTDAPIPAEHLTLA